MEGRGRGRRLGGRGGSRAGRQRACASQAGAAPRPARPEVPLLPWARGRVSHGPAPSAPPPGPSRLCRGAGPGLSFGHEGPELTGALEPQSRRRAAVRRLPGLHVPASHVLRSWPPGHACNPSAAASVPGGSFLREGSRKCKVRQVLLTKGPEFYESFIDSLTRNGTLFPKDFQMLSGPGRLRCPGTPSSCGGVLSGKRMTRRESGVRASVRVALRSDHCSAP